ncbi:putative iron-sulfur cluster-binding metallochaperone [Sulfurovum sp. NBC37-1]|uniref:putative iron-sulfur cluster-binding metallochaperone n=1 Tax=Sulfurovum sp. (strain NBC37-1) TaxID=387093 RepID=UPI0001587802|nr:copper chaperone Copz family protein [Sulfurovum sp. NBC37-1]BAF71650.1 conserved hypothetical protein [Sulfurovum sp. NBC37-1]
MFTFKPTKEKKQESCCSTQKEESCDTESHSCCTPQPKGKAACPSCGEKAKGVLGKTLEHLLANEAKAGLSCLDGFYYCKTPTCKVIYFRGEEILTQHDVSVIVGLKEGASPVTVCYCFDWTKEKIEKELEETGKTDALEDIKAKMEDPGCSCEILNPSGGCCLGDVGKAIKEIEAGI